MQTWRRKLAEYEADLYTVPLPRFFRIEKGEVELKKYEDGEHQLEIKFYGVKVPDGQTVSVVIDGVSVCEVPVHRGRGRMELSLREGEGAPIDSSPQSKVGDGSIVEIQYKGEALLRGVFRTD